MQATEAYVRQSKNLESIHFVFYVCKNHSLTNKQFYLSIPIMHITQELSIVVKLFNFSENRRPEVVFIGVNYVTFVSGYDPSANLSVVVWCFVVIQQNFRP